LKRQKHNRPPNGRKEAVRVTECKLLPKKKEAEKRKTPRKLTGGPGKKGRAFRAKNSEKKRQKKKGSFNNANLPWGGKHKKSE